MFDNSDQSWEAIGKVDAYYGVLTYDQYTRERLDPARREEFFQTGEEHCWRIFNIIYQHLQPDFAPKRALDFGCGVGRILIPLAQHCTEVVGMDVAASMLAEARANCAERDLTNVSFAASDDALSQVSGDFDFIHSFIVFQHIPKKRGERILEE